MVDPGVLLRAVREADRTRRSLTPRREPTLAHEVTVSGFDG
jgi:hypothetical protein